MGVLSRPPPFCSFNRRASRANPSHLLFAPGDSGSGRKHWESPGAENRRLSGNVVPLIPFLSRPRKRKEAHAETPPGASQPVKHEGERKGEKNSK